MCFMIFIDQINVNEKKYNIQLDLLHVLFYYYGLEMEEYVGLRFPYEIDSFSFRIIAKTQI